MNNKRWNIALVGALLAGLAGACREDEKDGPARFLAPCEGIFVLNEGTWQRNNASLDFWYAGTGEYASEVFRQANPGAVLGLGDAGNDIGLHGSKLYLVINGSNKVEVLDAATGRRLATIPFTQPRNVAFANGHAYVSAYGGAGSSLNGIVAEVDTATLRVTRTVEVGRQPEDLVAVGNKLYVANSGGLPSASGYERTITVLALDDFTRKDIPVAINLQRLAPDGNGNLYASSRGDYANVAPKLFVVDLQAEHVVDSFNIPASKFVIAGERAYILGERYFAETKSTAYSYHVIDTRTRTLLEGNFIREEHEREIDVPYGIAVHPVTGNIYVTDAKTFDIAGKILCFSPSGEKLAERTTGVIPAHIAFR
jgi:YVTN family beta-propeller protein